jgi:hypothetical protein
MATPQYTEILANSPILTPVATPQYTEILANSPILTPGIPLQQAVRKIPFPVPVANQLNRCILGILLPYSDDQVETIIFTIG